MRTSIRMKMYYGLIICLVSIFIFSVFKNISYPLLWNDEAETAMYAKRILEFGYPKVHDEKNTVCLLGPFDFGARPEWDAYVSSVWGQYYFAALGEFFAQYTEDLYTKTAILRLPFACAGLAGILILMYTGMSLFRGDKNRALIFGIVFLILEISSVSLVLHLREVRYYSLSILWTAMIMGLYLNFRLNDKIKPSHYFSLMISLLFLLFNSFPPACFSCLISMGIIFIYDLISNKKIIKAIIPFSPCPASLIFIIPLLQFHKTFQISESLAVQFHVTAEQRIKSLQEIITFLSNHELFGVILVSKIILLFVYLTSRKTLLTFPPLRIWIRISTFIFLFVCIHIFLVLKMPFDFTYVRYYIVCQPFLSLMLLFDLFSIGKIFSLEEHPFIFLKIKYLAALLLIPTLSLSLPQKIQAFKNHFYELSHQYKGVLDYAIPFIQSLSKNPESLVIATNYEECSYMYYLKSKVIIGCNNINLKEDLKETPDIIIPRKQWKGNFPEIIEHFLKKSNYSAYYFPVYDLPVNNYPQLGYSLEHQFKTKLTENEKEMFILLVKQ